MKTAFRTNLILIAITDDEMKQLQATEGSYEELLMPRLVSLTAQERRRMSKIGTANIDFTTTALAYGQARPDLVPSYTDVDNATTNLATYNALCALQQQRAVMDRAIEDTIMQCGSIAYTAGLGIYDTSKVAANKGTPGAAAIADDLAGRLPRRRGRASSAKPPVVPATKGPDAAA